MDRITDEQLAADEKVIPLERSESPAEYCWFRACAIEGFPRYVAEVRRLRELLRRAERIVVRASVNPVEVPDLVQLQADITKALGP